MEAVSSHTSIYLLSDGKMFFLFHSLNLVHPGIANRGTHSLPMSFRPPPIELVKAATESLIGD